MYKALQLLCQAREKNNCNKYEMQIAEYAPVEGKIKYVGIVLSCRASKQSGVTPRSGADGIL